MGVPILYATGIFKFLSHFWVPMLLSWFLMSLSWLDLVKFLKNYACFVCFWWVVEKTNISQKCVFPATHNADCESLVLCLQLFSPATRNTDCRCGNIFNNCNFSSHNMHPTIANYGLREVVWFMNCVECFYKLQTTICRWRKKVS